MVLASSPLACATSLWVLPGLARLLAVIVSEYNMLSEHYGDAWRAITAYEAVTNCGWGRDVVHAALAPAADSSVPPRSYSPVLTASPSPALGSSGERSLPVRLRMFEPPSAALLNAHGVDKVVIGFADQRCHVPEVTFKKSADKKARAIGPSALQCWRWV